MKKKEAGSSCLIPNQNDEMATRVVTTTNKQEFLPFPPLFHSSTVPRDTTAGLQVQLFKYNCYPLISVQSCV